MTDDHPLSELYRGPFEEQPPLEALDTTRSSVITGHPFMPGRSPYLCGVCRLAEAAHRASVRAEGTMES